MLLVLHSRKESLQTVVQPVHSNMQLGQEAVYSRGVFPLQELTKTVPAGARIVLCCSGRGDKDVNAAMRYFDMESGQIRDNLDQLT